MAKDEGKQDEAAKAAELGSPDEIATSVWIEIVKLRDEIPPPTDADDGAYPDSRAADAFQAADQIVASLCAVSRDTMLEGFTKLIEGQRLDDLLNAIVKSNGHPALRHSCLMVMCGVASLKQAHDVVAQRRDVLEALLNSLANPKAYRISPQGAEEDLDVNPAVGAAICLNSLLVSCGGLSPETIKIWAELDALTAITSALEKHFVFEGGGDEDVLPAMLFGLATPLLLDSKDAGESKNTGRLRLAEALLTLLAERREWVARSLAMAANASPTNLSGGAGTPGPVTINNLLVNSLAHPDLLGLYTRKAPVRLRARAVSAARQCQAEGTFALGFAEQLARLLGLGGQQEYTRRMAGMAVDKMIKKKVSKTKAVTCARPSCGKRQGDPKSSGGMFKVCSRCQSACYCSGDCQAAHWREGHKKECKKK